MANLNKLTIVPDQIGYSAGFGSDTISSSFDISSFFRRNLFNNARAVTLTWECSPCEYNYIAAAYRYFKTSGGVPFLIDLLLDKATLTEHKAVFQLGSFKLNKVQGKNYTVVAVLIVEPTRYDTRQHPFVVDSALKDLVLKAQTGVYSINGQNAKLRNTNQKFVASTGFYSIIGGTVKSNYRLETATGYYSISFQSESNLITHSGDNITDHSGNNILFRS